jgi:hypothetical protein
MSSSNTSTPNSSLKTIQQSASNSVDRLKQMSESTQITLMTFLTFFIVIMAFLYYFYYNGTGNIGGISIIIMITVMMSVVGQALMDKVGAVAGGILGALIGIAIFVRMTKGKDARNCDLMNGVYGEKNVDITNTIETDFSFYDYYIKTAYNCCSGGNYRNDYVSLCALNDLLKQGVRCLDFEIYSVDDEPVVATSTVDNYCVKETFNYVKFSDVINTIINNAFTDNAPNPSDPIVLHLRIKSDNKNIYKKMAQMFQANNNYFLGPAYSNEMMDKNGNIHNFGKTKLSALKSKIVVIVDKTNPTCLCASDECVTDCDGFYEYVNMTSNSTFMQVLRYNDIQYTQTPDDLISYNKTRMTIGIPDKGPNPANPSSLIMRELGCQMLAMRYQMVDTNVEENDLFFNEKGHAFVLKPPNLRMVDVVLPPPPEQKPELYYDSREVKSDFYNLPV